MDDDLRSIETHLRARLELEAWAGIGWVPHLPTATRRPPPGEPLDAAADPARALAAIDVEAQRCTRCVLAGSRTRVVFGVGNPNADLVLVGEAPGFHEDQQGEPFVGRAGGLLTRMLARIDLAREDVYICNVLKCRPPDNRDPLPEEKAACTPFLVRQLEVIGPRCILALGGHAAKFLLDKPPESSTGRLRGRVHRWHDIPLVVTYHPAYLLRRPPERWKALDDLHLARDVLAGLRT